MSRPPNGMPNGYRNASNSSNPPPGLSIANNPAAMSSQTRVGQVSRAERFEDEKRRIIDSCFSKTDQNGQLAESYITHIRIQEDGQYPSTPSPPDSNPDTKKPRLVIIAVRSTGRVRMHKARENNNGSFSIGKTWNLEDLAAIESFSNISIPPQSDQEAQYRSWAGSVGFTVTITKPYYWQAGTAKEKEFFIASAVKIYRKYTKGQVPELRGFEESQKAQMLGAMPGQPPPQQPPSSPPPPQMQDRDRERRRAPNESQSPKPPQPPFASHQRPQSREESRYRESPGPPPSIGGSDYRASPPPDGRRPSGTSSRPSASPAPQPPPALNVPKPFASNEHLRPGSSSSREGRSQEPRTMPPSGLRSPPPNVGQMPRAPSAHSNHSGMVRADSPANSSVISSREAPTPVFAPPQQQKKSSFGTSSMDDQRQMPPPNDTIAQDISPPQQRWQTEKPPPQPRSPPPTSQSQAPQLPPIETHQAPGVNRTKSTPKTAGSESSAGIGSDPAAFASVAGFMGPEHSFAGPPPPAPAAAAAPMSPPKSRARRPTLEGSSLSDPELRTEAPLPAPLKSKTPDDGATSVAVVEPVRPPLEPTKMKSDSDVPTRNGIAAARAAIGPSPLGAPAAETPNDEEAAKEAEDEIFRPGLGPMIKKKVVADRMKKAAFAASAFKPRIGGAAEKIMKAKAEREGGAPDGITGVVPRPAPPKLEDLAVKEPEPPPTPRVEVQPGTPAKEYEEQQMDGANGVQLSDQSSASRLQAPEQQKQAEMLSPEKVEQRQIRQPQIKVKRRSGQQEKYLAELGIERSLLKDKCLDFEMMLYDFGWNDAELSMKSLADMEADLRREQSRLDAGSWLSAPSQETSTRQERESQVLGLLDKAIQECDEMDGLLTIYNVELSSLNEDIAYIEAQSQGLQVQAANQRNLQNELQNLVQTLSLDKRALEPLRHVDLSNARSLEDVENGLKQLYTAMITIDPQIRSQSSGRPRSRQGMLEGNSDIGSMAAVRKKQDAYLQQSEAFCQRLMQQLDSTFQSSFNGAKSQALVPATGSAGDMKLNLDAYTNARKGLWVYSPLILFTKELNPPAWGTLMRMYHQRAKMLYADAFGQNVASWRRVVRQATGEEGDILFTAQEKDEAASGGVVSSARKLTVKRSQTLAKTLRTASGEKPASAADSRNSGSLHHCEVFSGAMDEMAPLVSQEQNFVVDLFHATSLETADFMDVAAATPPDQRYGTNLLERKPMDPDREMARKVTGVMDEIFGSFTNELSNLLDWSLSVDPIQGVGVMACLSRHAYYLQDSAQEFLIQLTDTLMARLQNLFAKFVDEQVRAIEDTKVKIKKRKGVIAFMKTFPHFSAAVENTFASVGGPDYEQESASMYEVRRRVDEAYARINRAIFDSLKVIAKESPAASAPQKSSTTDDAEDKEKLNYHVLLIENMNHYLEEVDDGGRKGVLSEWKEKAEMERKEAMEAYIAQVMRRPLGKLLEFLDSIDSTRESHPGNPSAVTSRPSFSRKNARNVLSQYDAKEIRRGIDHLRSRIEKHFHGDDEAISRALVALVSKECERTYESTITRAEDMIRELYPNVEGEKPVELDFSKADVQTSFRR